MEGRCVVIIGAILAPNRKTNIDNLHKRCNGRAISPHLLVCSDFTMLLHLSMQKTCMSEILSDEFSWSHTIFIIKSYELCHQIIRLDFFSFTTFWVSIGCCSDWRMRKRSLGYNSKTQRPFLIYALMRQSYLRNGNLITFAESTLLRTLMPILVSSPAKSLGT